MLHLSLVEFGKQGGHRLVQLGQAEEFVVPQSSQDPALDNLYPGLDFSFVARFAYPCRHHCDSIVPGKILVSGVQVWLIQVRAGHARLQIVRHQYFRYTPQECQCPNMRGDPVGQRLLPMCFGVGAQSRDCTG